MPITIDPDQLWMVVVGFIIAFALAFGIGANDVANSFGTSVGSKVLTMKQACFLATIFETLGAILVGAKVSDTIRKGIIDVEPYHNQTSLLMAGNVAALSGSCAWLLSATVLRMPVSGTHSIVGATVGFAIVVNGLTGINWNKLGLIVGSWFISPILSGIVSTALFYFCKYFILDKEEALEPGLKWMPLFYGATIAINFFSVFFEGPELLKFDKIPLYGVFLLSIGGGLIVAVIIRYLIVPCQRKIFIKKYRDIEPAKNLFIDNFQQDNNVETTTTTQTDPKDIELKTTNVIRKTTEIHHSDNNNPSPSPKDNFDEESCSKNIHTKDTTIPIPIRKLPPLELELPNEKVDHNLLITEPPEVFHIFSNLQILTAIFGSFAHGGNDVSNAIGPLVSLWLVATQREVLQTAPTPVWILGYGGLGISIGLWLWGRRVIKTLGEDLTKITPSSGFCIEIGAAFTVLVASNIGIPISTTHCKVGSVVSVGRFRSKENVDWSIFRNIVFAWLVTLPVSGGIAAMIMMLLRLTL